MTRAKAIAQLQSENAVMREALNWYAFKGNWRRRGVNPKGAPRKWEKSPAAFDRGGRARVVIKLVDSPAQSVWARLFNRLMGKAVARVITVPSPLSNLSAEEV